MKKEEEEVRLANKRISIEVDPNSEEEIKNRSKTSTKTNAQQKLETAKVIEYKKPEVPMKAELARAHNPQLVTK